MNSYRYCNTKYVQIFRQLGRSGVNEVFFIQLTGGPRIIHNFGTARDGFMYPENLHTCRSFLSNKLHKRPKICERFSANTHRLKVHCVLIMPYISLNY